MINDKDFVQLSESCSNVCEVLNATIQGKNVEDLNESVRTTLEDSERYFNLHGSVCLSYRVSPGFCVKSSGLSEGGRARRTPNMGKKTSRATC